VVVVVVVVVTQSLIHYLVSKSLQSEALCDNDEYDVPY